MTADVNAATIITQSEYIEALRSALAKQKQDEAEHIGQIQREADAERKLRESADARLARVSAMLAWLICERNQTCAVFPLEELRELIGAGAFVRTEANGCGDVICRIGIRGDRRREGEENENSNKNSNI